VSGGVGRLEIFGLVLTVAGLLISGHGLWRLAAAIRARFTYGAPYRAGTATDRLVALAIGSPLPVLGAALVFLAAAQAGFQPNEGTIRVGRIDAHRSGWGKMAVRFAPDPSYPGRAVLEDEISGARWAVAGDFLTWDRGVKWLGLRDGHRVRYLIGAEDSTGTSRGTAEETRVLEPLPPAAARLVALRRFLPFLSVRTEASPWFPPADRQVMVLYAIGPGYLAESVAEGGLRRPGAR
jgi:hypothetical protein